MKKNKRKRLKHAAEQACKKQTAMMVFFAFLIIAADMSDFFNFILSIYR